MSDERMRERVLSFLYGELTAAEEQALRAELAADGDLARILAQEEALLRLLPIGGRPHLPSGLLAHSRLRVQAALRREGRAPQSLAARLGRALQGAGPWLTRAGIAAALLLCGVLLGRTAAGPDAPAATTGSLVDLRVRRYDSATGLVELELSALTTTRLRGEVRDPRVQAALAAALGCDLEPGPRLEVVALLGQQTAAADTRRALAQALLADDNPGVRIAAAEALRGLAADEEVRRALHQALLEDDNPGVRIAAIDGLRSLRDPATRQALARSAHAEANQYIRAEARRALAEDRGATPTPL